MIPAEPPAGRFTGVLNVPSFRHYFVARTVSQFGDRLVPVALAFAVLRATHSDADLSLVLISSAAAQLAVLPAGGVIADRWPRRSLMIVTDLAQCAVTAAVLIGGRWPGHRAVPAAAPAALGAARRGLLRPAAAGPGRPVAPSPWWPPVRCWGRPACSCSPGCT
jgi:hypothetical protein